MKRGGTVWRWVVLAACVIASHGAMAADAETSLEAFSRVRAWVDGWEIPEDARVWLGEDATGVCVTLRYEGVVVGRAVRMRADDTALGEAARDAMNEAEYALPVWRDATQQEQLVAIASEVTVDVQVAGEMTPLLGAGIAEVTREVSPGREGVAVRVGQSIAGVFGGSMLSTNQTPGESLRSAMSELELPLLTLEELRDSHDVIVYRFDSIHVAQSGPGEPGLFLHRGGRMRTMRDVNTRGLREMGDGIAAHLLLRRDPSGTGGLRGTYEAWTDRYGDVAQEDLYAQAMASLALARWSHVRTKQGLDDAGLMRVALWVLEEMTLRREDVTSSASASAMFVIASRELSVDGVRLSAGVQAMRAECLAFLQTKFHRRRGFDGDVPVGARGMMCLAIAETPDGEAAMRRLLRDLGPTELTSAMPWLGWTTMVLAPAGGELESSGALRSMRELVWRHQLQEVALPAPDRDLAGGIVFTSSSNPLPNAQLVRPMAMLATMLGDTRLTSDEELTGELTSLMRSVRFLQQLCAGEAESHMYADAEASLWGVRNALWDQRMSLEHSAMALMVVTETLDSVFRRTAGGD
ncbi:MAG: hypothetical protein ACYTF7_09135 [Planctomycetota bacterium]|jgi:hypothetical protein